MKILAWVLWKLPNFLTGTFTAASAYFIPIKGIVKVTMAAIILDLILGIWAARKRKEGIKGFKLWRTIYKMFISFALLHLLFSIDTEYSIETPHTYIIAGLFIVGFEIWSILENAAVITDHKAFRFVKKYMEDKVKKVTGIHLDSKFPEDEPNPVE